MPCVNNTEVTSPPAVQLPSAAQQAPAGLQPPKDSCPMDEGNGSQMPGEQEWKAQGDEDLASSGPPTKVTFPDEDSLEQLMSDARLGNEDSVHVDPALQKQTPVKKVRFADMESACRLLYDVNLNAQDCVRFGELEPIRSSPPPPALRMWNYDGGMSRRNTRYTSPPELEMMCEPAAKKWSADPNYQINTTDDDGAISSGGSTGPSPSEGAFCVGQAGDLTPQLTPLDSLPEEAVMARAISENPRAFLHLVDELDVDRVVDSLPPAVVTRRMLASLGPVARAGILLEAIIKGDVPAEEVARYHACLSSIYKSQLLEKYAEQEHLTEQEVNSRNNLIALGMTLERRVRYLVEGLGQVPAHSIPPAELNSLVQLLAQRINMSGVEEHYIALIQAASEGQVLDEDSSRGGGDA